MKLFLLLLALQAGPQDTLAPILERWRSGNEDARLQALQDAARLRRSAGEAALARFAEPPVPKTWEHPDRLLDLVSREKIVSWYPLLVPLLDTGDTAIRVQVLEELARRDLKPLSGAVVPLLTHPVSAVGWQAAFTLIVMDARDRVPEIAPLLKGSDDSVRLNVLHLLCKIGRREHGRFVAPLLDDPDPVVGIAAVEVLGRIQAREFSAKVVRFLEAEDPVHRQAAVAALAGMGARDQAKKVAERLLDAEVLVRWEAVRALGRLRAREHANAIVSLSEDDGATAPVLEALGQLGQRDLAAHILPYLDTPDPGIRWRAVRALGGVDARNDAGHVADMLRDSDSYVRLCALQSLGAMGATAHTDAMMVLLRDDESDVCQGAAEELSALVTPAQIKSVVSLLDDDDPFVRWSSLNLLVAAGAKGSLPEIAGRLRKGGAVNGDILRAIGRLDGREHADKILEALKTEEGLVRQQAVFAIARLSAGAAELEAVERSSEGAMKLAAGVALVRLGKKDRVAAAALLGEFLLHREEPDYQRIGDEIVDALAAGFEKDAVAALSRDVTVEKRIESVRDLQALLGAAGIPLASDETLELRRRLPGGKSMTARRLLEWSFGSETRLVPVAGKIVVLEATPALEQWQKRLDQP